MARYKVLPLPRWATRLTSDNPRLVKTAENCLVGRLPMEPVFNRPGWYFDRVTKTAWIEVDGRAWVDGRSDDFTYHLAVVGHQPLAAVERDAIQALVNRNLCPRALRELLVLDRQMRMLRGITISGLKARKRLIAIKASR